MQTVIMVMSSTLFLLKARFLLVDCNMITYIHPLQQSRSGLFTHIMSSSGPCITVIMIMSSSWSRHHHGHVINIVTVVARQVPRRNKRCLHWRLPCPFPQVGSQSRYWLEPDQSQSGYFTGLDTFSRTSARISNTSDN